MCLSRMECPIPSHIIMYIDKLYIYISIHTQSVYIYIPIHHTTFLLWCHLLECSRSVQWNTASPLVPDLRDSKEVQQIFRCSRLPDNLPNHKLHKNPTVFLITPLYNMKGGETHGRMLTRESIGVHGSHHIKFKMLHLLAVARTETECFLPFHTSQQRKLCNCKLWRQRQTPLSFLRNTVRIENVAYQTVSRNRKKQLTATSFASCLPSNWSIIGRSRPFEPFLDHLKHFLKGRLHARIYLELQATSFKSKWMFVETTIFQVQMFWLLSPGAYDPPTKVCVVFSLLFMWFFCAPENLTFKTCGMNFMCHDVYGKMPFPENMLFTVMLGKL